jgi:uncharacterized protein involved in outer membrane biogenesis
MRKVLKYATIIIVLVISALSIFHLIQNNKIDENTLD